MEPLFTCAYILFIELPLVVRVYVKIADSSYSVNLGFDDSAYYKIIDQQKLLICANWSYFFALKGHSYVSLYLLPQVAAL